MGRGKLIKKNTKTTVSNSLNEMFFEQRDMNMQAFRMLMFYLAKIDPKKPDKTEVKVSLQEYAEMLGVELNENAIDRSTDMLLGYIVKIKPEVSENSEFEILNRKVQAFSECSLQRRKKDGELFLTFKCHDELKPHIFNLKNKFTKFEVWNILNLGNFQDMRMYMLLSQYRVAGERNIELAELKEKLGIDKNSYPEYKIFVRDVLKKCQKALGERTDICFEFKAVGRPAHSVYFKIYPNKDYAILPYLDETLERTALPTSANSNDPDQLSIDVAEEKVHRILQDRDARAAICAGFDDEIFAEFTDEQLTELRSLAWNMVDPDDVEREQSVLGNFKFAKEYVVSKYIRQKILMCNSQGNKVKHRYGYIKRAVSEDWR